LISPAFAVQISANPVKGAIALANAVGPMMVSKGMPALASFILRTEAENKAIDAVPIIGWIFELVSLAATAAQILETTVATLATPATTSIDVVRTMNLTVDVNPDPVHSVWPSTSYYYRIMVQYRGGTFQHVDGEMSTITHGVTSSALLEKVFNGVPAGGSLMVYAVIYSQNYWICGYAASNWMDATPDSSGNLKVTLNITEQLVPLSKDTQYSHMEKLTYASPGGHQWTAGAAPTATATSLQDVDTGHNLAALGGITINDRAHMLGYSWRASGQSLPLSGSTTPTPANGQMSAFQNISYLAQPEAALKSSNVGYTGMQRIAYDQFGPLEKDASGTGYNFFLDAQSDGTHLRSVAMDDTTAFDLSGTKSWGKFSQANLDAVVVHPGGYVIAVSWENSKMEILTIPNASSADADAPTATLVSGQGARDGLMHGPVALAVTPDGKVLVLEGTNQRIQAFDTKGNPVRAFTDPVGGRAMQATIALKKQTQAVTYLDMGTESKGYIYVLYYLGKGDVVSDYNLDIYDPEGNFLSTTNGLNAAKFVVSMWRDVYGLNYEVLLGPGSRTEPSVSHWIPSTPPGVQP
jgi:hypothetical protein